MSRTDEFCQEIGLTPSVRRWLADNDGNPYRDEIVFILTEAIHSGLAKEYLQILRSKIAKITAIRVP